MSPSWVGSHESRQECELQACSGKSQGARPATHLRRIAVQLGVHAGDGSTGTAGPRLMSSGAPPSTSLVSAFCMLPSSQTASAHSLEAYMFISLMT